ncbi:hypothetical protein EGW08_015821 [Elysia chlorotica]|uniref:SCP domain-containing protein n=1 Tax=Elysia chlorotica TaxID=188477 RepID=A0A433T4F4_ELYCH|nr:hypothetical protein EGW08_015821 [Elysia chlorotica]
MEEFRQQTLRTHNMLRARHGAAPLKLSDELNVYAQHWCEAMLKNDIIKHSDCLLHGSRIGENIAYRVTGLPHDLTGQETVMHWYEEVRDHNFASEEFNTKTAHFTQVVWKGTQELGVGKAKSYDGRKAVIVCTYRPPGNYLGQITANVSKPQ